MKAYLSPFAGHKIISYEKIDRYQAKQIKDMTTQELMHNFCYPYAGCSTCESKCEYGKEYLRRV